MVQLRFNANQVKRDVNEILDRKVKAIKNDDKLYTNLLWAFYGAFQPLTPVDTGAFAYAAGGEAKDGHVRQGYLTISAHHGIERDAVDTNPNTGRSQHYYRPLLGKILDLPEGYNGQDIYENMDYGDQVEFLEKAAELITESMNEH